jgi:GNAT superfamily N-acetyltransferase
MTRWLLEMQSPSEFKPSTDCPDSLEVHRVTAPSTELNRVLHATVGKRWQWGGRHDWGQAEWGDYVHRDALETWIAYVEGKPAGYYEMEKQEDGSVRIQCFGLLEAHIGKGFGGPFLSHAVARCWERGATRVWLNTCSRDHPNAIHNYRARGFSITSESVSSE